MTRWIGPTIAAAATLLFAALALTSDGWAVLWFAMLAVGGVAETIALIRRAPGDTFSETVWTITKHPAAKIALAIGLCWLTAHLVFGL